LDLKVWRDHRVVNLNVELLPPQHLVAEDRYDVKPTYYIFGGLLFVPLTRDYLKTWGQHWWAHAPHPLMAKYETAIRTPAQHEVVVLQKVLAEAGADALLVRPDRYVLAFLSRRVQGDVARLRELFRRHGAKIG